MNPKKLTESNLIRFIYTLLIAMIGGYLFQKLHLPVPWLLGPMLFVFTFSRMLKPIRPHWPGYVRNTGMIIVGYVLGLSFTYSTFIQISKQLSTMILMTVLLIIFCIFIAWIMSRITGIPFQTLLLGSIPGGLTQMIILAEETKGIDITLVTFLQVSRLMMIITLVPMLIFSPVFGARHAQIPISTHTAVPSWNGLFPNILLYAAVCTLAALLGKKIRFPTAFLLGPMLAAIVLHLSGVFGPALPPSLTSASQLMVGSYVGLLLKPENLVSKSRTVLMAVVSGIILITGAFFLSLLLTTLHPVSAATAFLSLSPGGMDQMSLIAQEIHADLTIVACYQLFRTLFIFIAVPPLIKWIFQLINVRESNQMKRREHAHH
ncbi:AbrB family transcriptional regulator [Paenibacillus sp. SN-8-1]|uniref:AbrB family transcriptional regulator n=1 Tax=Paenibacillus sp. SN-8-1 TaxID=3435409 RepID=UPI003D9A61E2